VKIIFKYNFKMQISGIVTEFDWIRIMAFERLCGLVVRVPGYRSRGQSSIPGFTSFSEK
jgi:hypothetical protein